MKKNVLTDIQLKIIQKYIKAAQKGRYPTRADMLKLGVSRDKIRSQFGNLEKLKDAARKHDEDAFSHIIDESLFTKKALTQLKTESKKYNRFLVTTAVDGCKVHKGFFDSVYNTYAPTKDALPLVLTAADPAANADRSYMDPAFRDSMIVFGDMSLNKNVFLSSIKLSAKHIDPITGLSRIGQRNGSFLYASPKQRLKMTPTSNTKLPHAMMTTGAITEPHYHSKRYMSGRTAYIAEHDHVIGGVVVETDGKKFYFRQVQSDEAGNFIDLGVMYKPDGSTAHVRPEAMILGDFHSGETDPQALEAFITAKDSVMNVTKPKRLIIHDGFNGRSISHHEVKNRVLRAQRAARCELSLEDELINYARDLQMLASYDFIEEIILVKSNHDEFLERYLADGRYVEDALNHAIGLKLASAMVEGKNPLQVAIEGLLGADAEKIVWLDRDEDFKIANIELGAHGDLGSGGARGSLRAMENGYGSSVSGHAHSPEILRNAWQVGTMSYLKLNYNRGMSSWLHSSCLLYPNGSRQLINVIEGEWQLKD